MCVPPETSHILPFWVASRGQRLLARSVWVGVKTVDLIPPLLHRHCLLLDRLEILFTYFLRQRNVASFA